MFNGDWNLDGSEQCRNFPSSVQKKSLAQKCAYSDASDKEKTTIFEWLSIDRDDQEQ